MTPSARLARRLVPALAAAVAAATLAGCAPGSLAREGAASGAKTGAVGGAVAGAVGSIFWGGNVLENAAAAAVTGAAAGAAVGAVSGGTQDRQYAKERQMSEADLALQRKIGPDNYAAAGELANCRHKTAIGKAKTAYGRAATAEQRKYALMVEAIANEELGATAEVERLYPLLQQNYAAGTGPDAIRADIAEGRKAVEDARRSRGLSPTCE